MFGCVGSVLMLADFSAMCFLNDKVLYRDLEYKTHCLQQVLLFNLLFAKTVLINKVLFAKTHKFGLNLPWRTDHFHRPHYHGPLKSGIKS